MPPPHRTTTPHARAAIAAASGESARACHLRGGVLHLVDRDMGGSTMQATQKELVDAKIDLAYRDFCAHLLIPLNECRRKSYYLPWKCEHERHVYEKCQYKE